MFILLGLYSMAQTMITCQDKAATLDGLFSIYYVFNEVLFDYLKAYYNVSQEPGMDQTLMLLTLNIPLYSLPGLNVRMPDKPLTIRLLDKDTGPIYGEVKQKLTHTLKNNDTEFYGNEEEFQGVQKDSLS